MTVQPAGSFEPSSHQPNHGPTNDTPVGGYLVVSPRIVGPVQPPALRAMNIKRTCKKRSSGLRAACLRLAAFALATFAGSAAWGAEPETKPAAESLPAAPVVPAESKVSNDYVIGPGDTLQVYVWRNPELTVTVPVRPDGKISTPLVEDMIAVGKTPSQLARDVEKVLGEYVRSPQINVIVTQPMAAFSQVKIIGQVTRPQSIAYREGLTVLDAVLAVGGLGPFAAGNRAKVMRVENGKQREIKVKLASLVNGGDMKQNILLRPGDVIVIPESRF
jgi:polysaccharide biosynthesis/export protein